jgi:hypothetical protein
MARPMKRIHPPPAGVPRAHITPRRGVPSVLARLGDPPPPDCFHRHTTAYRTDHTRSHWGILRKIPTNLERSTPLRVRGATPNGAPLLHALRRGKVSTHSPTHELRLPLTRLREEGRRSGIPSLRKAMQNRANTGGAGAGGLWVGERPRGGGVHTRRTKRMTPPAKFTM